uniref:Cyanate hydratase n=1 Tax=Ditylenchus dipsaci TaxID=166011 RepID=A0A915DDS7_9BILA
MISSREQVTQFILAEKVRRNLKWTEVASALGQSKEWVTAACLGQMQLTKPDAEQISLLFGLSDEACAWLQIAPHKSTSVIPSDPLLYRFYEVLGVYGPALKELIHEQFGDGIMSAWISQ